MTEHAHEAQDGNPLEAWAAVESASSWFAGDNGPGQHGREVRETFLDPGNVHTGLLRGVSYEDQVPAHVAVMISALAVAKDPSQLPEALRPLFGVDAAICQSHLTRILAASVAGGAREQALRGFTMNPLGMMAQAGSGLLSKFKRKGKDE